MILWIIAVLMIAAFFYLFYFRRQTNTEALYNHMTLYEMGVEYSNNLVTRMNVNPRGDFSEEQSENMEAARQLLIRTYQAAQEGEVEAREAMIQDIQAWIQGDAMEITNLDELTCVAYRDPANMSTNEKFITMMYFFRKEVLDSMTYMEKGDPDNDKDTKILIKLLDYLGTLKQKRPLVTDKLGRDRGYFVNTEDMREGFKRFSEEYNEGEGLEFTLTDAIAITALMVYQDVIGYSLFDMLVYDNSISELWSGSMGADRGSKKQIVSPENSICVAIQGDTVRLQCLRFPSSKAYENAILSFASTTKRTFTDKDGYIYTTLKHGRRVVLRRASVSDRWGVNIRTLETTVGTNEELLRRNKVPILNAEFIEDLLQIIAWSMIPSVFTGQQGTGKTTHLLYFLGKLETDMAVRAIGNIDEFNFGMTYPERDFAHFFTSDVHDLHSIAGMAKRTRGMVLVMSELLVSNDVEEALNSFKSGYLGGFTTGHGATTAAMIEYMAGLLAQLRNTTPKEMEKLVAESFKFNIKTARIGGVYQIEFIEEIIARDFNLTWNHFDDPRVNVDQVNKLMAENTTTYYKNHLDPQMFSVNRLAYFDMGNKEYVPVNPPSFELITMIFFRVNKERRVPVLQMLDMYYDLNPLDIIQQLIDTKTVIASSVEEFKRDWLGEEYEHRDI